MSLQAAETIVLSVPCPLPTKAWRMEAPCAKEINWLACFRKIYL